jgi:hypothetical protein
LVKNCYIRIFALLLQIVVSKRVEFSLSDRVGFSELAQALIDKSMTKKELCSRAHSDFSLIPLLLQGVDHEKANVRYGCATALVALSENHPEELYSHFDFFVSLLDSKYRILKWTALAIIANLTKVDEDKKFDGVFDDYFSFLNDKNMVTVANVVGNSGVIALAKPYLIPRITDELLDVKDLSLTPHLTEECKRVIAQHAIKTFDLFFDKVDQKKKVLSFVKAGLESSRVKHRKAAEAFIKKWA